MTTLRKQKKREMLLKFYSHLHKHEMKKKPAPMKRLIRVLSLNLLG